MTQETIQEATPEPMKVTLSRALIICEKCSHTVPRTMVCLYCGAPILFKKPQ
jgi:ribosomal protein L32